MKTTTVKAEPGKWFQLMLIAFLTNGIGPFGLKVLTELHLDRYELPYLVSWYAGGLALAALAYRQSLSFARWEVILGAGMGLCSLGGQYFTGKALALGVPGHVAFPITTGGTLFLVALMGIVIFRERVGAYGRVGLVLGILALVVLSFG
jgi:multidrug transporter EmrE-like cation transporter